MAAAFQALLTPFLVLSLACLSIVATRAIVASLRIGGRREDTVDHNDALSLSRFTIPLSVIVPSSRDSVGASRTITALLDSNYPELEVVVVIEEAQGAPFDAFSREWQLQANEFFFRRAIETGRVNRIYRSARDSRLVVVDKQAKGYADAVNCGANIARYRYVVTVSPGIVFDANALLRLMAAPLRDPATVVGASNHVEYCGRFERLASARSVMASRVVWGALPTSLGPPSGAVTVWRRDVILEAKGFSANAADPDLDMARRVLLASGDEHGRRFHRGADVFGRMPATRVLDALARRGTRQRAVLQCLRVLTPRGVRAVGARSLACFFGAELIVPLVQGSVIAGTLIGASAGWFSWVAVVCALLFLSFGNAAVTTAALLLRGASMGSPDEQELRGLLLAGPAELLLYRPALIAAGLVASLGAPTRQR